MSAKGLRQLLTWLACVACFLFVAVPESRADEVADIPDPTFHDCLTAALGLANGATLTTTALATLTTVECYGSSGSPVIRSLAGAEHLTGVKSLYLTGQDLSDVSPLAGLSSLRLLWINDCDVADADPLSALTGLRDLYLMDNPIHDVRFLTELTSLHNVALSGVPADVTPIAGLTTLTGVVLGANATSDYSFLTDLPILTYVEFHDDTSTTVPPLGTSTSVQELGLTGKAFTDLTAVGGLHQLRRLTLRTPALTSLDSLPALDHLEVLTAVSCGLTDVDGLTRLPELTSLNLENNRLTDAGAIAGLVHLNELSLRTNKLTALPDLAALDHLTRVDVGHNELTGLDGLDGLPALTSLAADSNRITDLTALKNLTQLRTASLSENAIVDVSPLAGLPHLATVNVMENGISDVSGFVADGVRIIATYQDVQGPPATVDTPAPLVLKGPDGQIPHLVPDAGVGVINGQITYSIPGTHHIDFSQAVGTSTFSGVLTQRAGPDGSFTVVTKPHITGYPAVGEDLSLSIKPWTPTVESYQYQWYRDGKDIEGATQSRYTLTGADLGHRFKAKVIGLRDAYLATTVWTESSPKVVKGTFSMTRPHIVGTARTGVTLSFVMDVWSPVPDRLTYRWYRGGHAIKGATKATYTLTAADLGHRIKVRVTGHATGIVTEGSSSAPTAVVKQGPVHSSVPLITGTPAVGQELMAQNGAWGPGKITFGYRWLRDGAEIPQATRRTYLVTDADAGHQLSVRVTGDRSRYTAVAQVSPAVSVT